MKNATNTPFEELSLIVHRIVASYHPEKIILFGSTLRGDQRDDSDIDMLIIKNDSNARHKRIQAVFRAIRGIKRSRAIDVIVYTPKEIEERVSIGDSFITDILQHGKSLYG